MQRTLSSYHANLSQNIALYCLKQSLEFYKILEIDLGQIGCLKLVKNSKKKKKTKRTKKRETVRTGRMGQPDRIGPNGLADTARAQTASPLFFFSISLTDRWDPPTRGADTSASSPTSCPRRTLPPPSP
jgi:hypothetical protein